MEKYNAYKFRIYPTPEQANFMWRTIGCCRKTYNLFIAEYDRLYQEYKDEKITKDELYSAQRKLDYPFFKNQEEYAYLAEVDSRALTYTKQFARKAHSDFLKGKAGHPQFKAYNKSRWSYKTEGSLYLHKGGWLKLPKIPTLIKINVHQNPKGVLKSAVVSKERSGKWYVSLLFVQKNAPNITPSTNPPVGLDMGISHLVVTSDGEKINNPKILKQYEKKLARIDRAVSRKREQAKKDGKKLSECKNYQKDLVKRAKLHEKIKNIRSNNLHNITHNLTSHYSTIAVEDLSTQNMMKNHHLAKSIGDASWAMLLSQLEYKTAREGGEVVKVDRFFPSSQQCSSCGEKTGEECKDLNIRSWTCSNCGTVHDRDINAAKNILAEALENR